MRVYADHEPAEAQYPVCRDCPIEDCSGEIVEKKSRKGKIFYSCSRYPDCKYALWNKPYPMTSSGEIVATLGVEVGYI